jgi:hypothetical protein
LVHQRGREDVGPVAACFVADTVDVWITISHSRGGAHYIKAGVVRVVLIVVAKIEAVFRTHLIVEAAQMFLVEDYGGESALKLSYLDIRDGIAIGHRHRAGGSKRGGREGLGGVWAIRRYRRNSGIVRKR